VNRKYSERDPTDEILRAFKLFVGEDPTGKINLRCLRKISKELGEELSEEELQAMIDEFDHDGDGMSSLLLTSQPRRVPRDNEANQYLLTACLSG
jgi:Ca2+-binding EF-hand superfamily protein